MAPTALDQITTGIPFSFTYGGLGSASLLAGWPHREESVASAGGADTTITTWTDVETGLRVECTTRRFCRYPAAEWILRFGNDGPRDTPVISEVRAADLVLAEPLADGTFVLHRLNGAPSNETDFEPRSVVLGPGDADSLGGGGGRSSNRDFPFFRIDTGEATLIAAVGWSGQWEAKLRCLPQQVSSSGLHLTAGLEETHFCLHPGEEVRGPRMLVLEHRGDPERSHSVFRRLIREHYASRAHAPGSITRQPISAGPGQGKVEPLPTLFCNTCFTRKGAWLNECNEENQISLLRALAPFGVQVILTDAGWFKGGWPHGAGNWECDPDKYPRGMAPVAAAASEEGMGYGLWFEPERVVPGTSIDRDHDQCVLSSDDADTRRGRLLDFGTPDARELFFRIVEEYLQVPGMGAYRQDFNMDPLPFWRDNEAPDRRGVREMQYVEGLYAFWDQIRVTHPDLFMEECASGGRRIDLETVRRFQVHQKSDYWFDSLVDQATLFALSAYLPNGAISVPIDQLDDYSFHSAMASSLIVGWIADAPDFDAARARQITDAYRSVRHLLNGDWHGLTPWSRDPEHWLVSQYHRGDLGEGMILAFRREECGPSLRVCPVDLNPSARYELSSLSAGEAWESSGAELMDGVELSCPEAPGSVVVVYREL